MLKKILSVLAIAVGGLAVVYLLAVLFLGRDQILVYVFGPIENEPMHFSSLVLKPSPNQFLVCPAEYCAAKPHLNSPTYPVSSEHLKQQWIAVVTGQPGVDADIVETADGQLTHIQRSSLMRYPDSITVTFLPLGETQSTLAIYSRSHYGKSDFGVNEKRIRAWLAELEVSLPR